MTPTPTDALRLVPSRDDGLTVGRAILEAHSQWEKEHGVTGAQNPWQEQHVILLGQAAILAAPASPLPEGGGQCSGITGELDSRLVEWGYTSLDEAITHLGKLLDDQTAFDGLAAQTGDRP